MTGPTRALLTRALLTRALLTRALLTRARLAARGHENGPGLTSFAATFGSVGPSP